MIEVRCPNCNSEDVYFSKKRLKYVCEDCEYEFMDKETLIPKRVFISYAHDEYAVFVDEVYAILKGIGVNIWKDDYEIKGGDDWRRSITEGIKQSSHVIAFISTKSIRNPGVCLDELQIAVSQNKNIIPIRFDNVELPSSISYLQWKDVGQDKSQTIADYILQQIVKNENVSDSLKSLEQKFCPFSFATKLKILYSNNNFIRNDILQQVDEWVLSAKKLLWIKGNPGTGKSIIAGQVYSRRSYVNSIFFCEWEMSRVTTFSSIVKTIAFQLAQRNADYRDLLESVDISQVADNNLLYEIIVKPFQQLINGNRDIKVIWIDAIDELSTEVCNELIKEFLIAIKILPTWLKIVFTSRYKEEYDKHYDNDFIRCLDLEEYNTESLIKEYVLYEFDRKSFKGKNNDILAEKIAKNSNGVFLYVDAVVSDIISNNKLQIIDNVPSSLYSLFEKYFDRAIRLNSVDKEFLLKLLGLIIVCKEVATVDYLSTILNEDEGVIIKELSFVSNYFLLFNENGDNIVKPYHKALVDWFKKLTINDPYYIDFNFINSLIIEKGLAQIEKNTLFTDYYTKWFFFDLVNSGKYKELSDNSLFDISLHIVKSAVHVGNHYVERDMIEKLNVYSTSADKRIICLDRLLQYQIRNNTSLIENTINEINALLDTIIDDEKRVSYLLKIAVAYFYLGKNKIGLESMKKIMNDYFDIIQASQQLKTEYSHNLGLFAHDLDKNMSVIENAQTSIEGYKKSGDEYSLLISKINLYDGYMGYGDLVKANNVIFDLDSKISSKTSLQVQDIHYICKANFLLTAGKVMTALYYYEKGITIASQISHKWDETYGKIWRELALSYYGEKNAFDNLKAIFFQLDEDNRFLKSLAGAFYYLSGYILKVDKFDDESLIAKYVTSSEFNGHIVIMQMVIDLLGIKSDISIKPELIVRHMIDCEGIKGGFTIVNDFLNAHEELDYLTESWAKKHLYGINNYRQTEKTRLLQNLDDSFCVKSFNCSTCQAMCCYDGVYVSAKEEKRIKRFVIEHKEFFQDLPETLFEYSNWMGVVEGRKTKTKDFHYSNPEYPKHFNDTRCVFALDNGACSLQVVATKLGLHPWSVKPQSCWLFPLDVDENGDVLPPPANKEKDPNYIKGVYEGYVSALPCGQCNSTGADWRETYINEIEYFYFRKELMNK